MITEKEYFSRNGIQIPARDIAKDHALNASVLIDRINALWILFEKEKGNILLIVNSGYRTKAINATIKGAAANSWHMHGKAVDIRDSQTILQRWLKTPAGIKSLETNGLYVEDFKYTKTWVHFQTVRPMSGNRFFIP
jgi:hypothetical protein